jgi:hypothetical protein
MNAGVTERSLFPLRNDDFLSVTPASKNAGVTASVDFTLARAVHLTGHARPGTWAAAVRKAIRDLRARRRSTSNGWE